MGEYAWGRSELIDFKNRQGKDLQGALFYPANYEPGKQYPMIVYIYEIVSPSVRSFSTPSERNAYNPAVWTQNGYFVLQPDIVYRDRDPGLSAKDALEPAVEAVVATGMVDPKRVGLVGQSWGGYQTAFMSSVSRTFAAGVAGAPLTELASMYLSIYWNSGGTDARIFEVSQGRMEVPPWEDLDAYTRNSAVWNIEKMETPLLMTFGDKDGAVDWHQGIVLYNAARRENKDLVMLVYEGENHGLAKKPNQIDYHRRVMQWFNHYLKGEPAPDWLKDGVKFLDKDKELKKAITSPISND
jgi:dipeptidyl aminopeptidase/acylaminoacyl peptidase